MMKEYMEGKSYSKEEFLKLNSKCVECGKTTWYLGAKHCRKCISKEFGPISYYDYKKCLGNVLHMEEEE